MYISPSAREAIGRMLAAAPAGSLPSLLVGYTYHEGLRIPQVDVCCYPPELVRPHLVREYDGLRFHEALPDSHALIAERTLTYVDGVFRLSTQ